MVLRELLLIIIAMGIGVTVVPRFIANVARIKARAQVDALRELERQGRLSGSSSDVDALQEQIDQLQTEVGRLTERLDFTEKLLTSGAHRAEDDARAED